VAIDYAVLKALINADPAVKAKSDIGADNDAASLLNAKDGPGSGPVSLATMPRGDMLLALLPAVSALAAKDDVTQKRWDRFLDILKVNESVRVGNAGVQALLTAAVAEGLMSEGYAATIGKVQGSVAEVNFGHGTRVTADDIGRARAA
jgi:hypothetical protein